MLRYHGSAHYIKYKNLILIDKLKLDDESDYHYFKNSNRLLCYQISKLRKVPHFKKFKTLKFNFSRVEYDTYFNRLDNRYEFRGSKLIPENEYCKTDLEQFEIDLYDHHINSCQTCNHQHQIKEIRKRKKLSNNEKLKLSYLIGSQNVNRSIEQSINVSRQVIKKYKKKIREADSTAYIASKKLPTFTSLSPKEKQSILDHNNSNPFDNPSVIKKKLKLECDVKTVRNVLSSRDIKAYSANFKPLVNSNQYNLRIRWCQIMRNLNQDQWNQIVFSDEKCLQSYNNGKVKVYRKRGEESDIHIYRRSLNRFKINLFGYITSTVIGNLYVFSDNTDSEKYINYLHRSVFPDVIDDVGPRFIWQQDGVGFYVSKLSLDYFNKINANLLVWPPASPDLNIIENVWSLLQKEVNSIIMLDGLPSNKEMLIEYSFRAWYSIDKQFIVNLYNSLPNRVLNLLNRN